MKTTAEMGELCKGEYDKIRGMKDGEGAGLLTGYKGENKQNECT